MRKLINYRPLVFFAVSICLGIYSSYLFKYVNVWLGILCVLAFLLFGIFSIFYTGDERKIKLKFAVAFALLFIIGGLVFGVKTASYDNADLGNHYYSICGKVSEKQETQYGLKLTLSDVEVDGHIRGVLKYKVAVYVYGESLVDVGDIINFSSYLSDKGSFYEGRFSAYDVERGIKYMAEINSLDMTITGKSLTLFERINLFFRDTLASSMDKEEFAVGYALLTGGTEYMDYDVISAYRAAGVAHVFAVSGLHIGFLAVVLGFIFDKLKMNKIVKAFVITIILLLYSGVCGFSASSLRATIMSAVVLFAAIKGERNDGLSSTGLAATLILIFSPVQLFCVGFQLSFIVVIGILMLSGPIAKLFKFLPTKFANSLGVVLSAQLVGIPICINAFGQFSLIAILANLLFIPVVGVLFVSLIIAAIMGGLFCIPTITLFLPSYAFKFLNMLITALDFNIFIVGGFTMGIFVLFYYLAIIAPSGIVNLRRVYKTVVSLVCASVCVVGTMTMGIYESKLSKAYVIGTETVSATVLTSGGEATLIVSSSDNTFSLSRLNRFSNREGVTHFDKVVITKGCKTEILYFITKLRTVFTIGKICYFGETDTQLETAVEKSFGYEIDGYDESKSIAFSDTYLKYELGGYAVEGKLGGRKFAILSEFGNDNADFLGLDGDFDFLVAYDYTEGINSVYSPKKFVVYRNSHSYLNAESSGTFTFKFK